MPAGPARQSLGDVHFPDSMEQAQAAARRRFALEEFFGIQFNVAWRRSRHQERNGRVLGKRTACSRSSTKACRSI